MNDVCLALNARRSYDAEEKDIHRRIRLARATRLLGNAADEARELLEPYRNDPLAAVEWGLIQVELGRHQEAKAALRRGLFDSAGEMKTNASGLGAFASLIEEETREAPSEVRRETYDLLALGLNRDPSEHELLRCLGVAQFHDGDLGGSHMTLKRLIRILDELPCSGSFFRSEARLDLATVLEHLGFREAALIAIEEGANLCPPWIVHRLQERLEHDPKLSTLRRDARFTLAYKHVLRTPARNAISRPPEQLRVPPWRTGERLPEIAALQERMTSDDPLQVGHACLIVSRLIASYELQWEERGYCAPEILRRATQVLDGLKPAWLLRHFRQIRPTASAVGLVASMIDSHHKRTKSVGVSIGIEALRNGGAGTDLAPILNALRLKPEGHGVLIAHLLALAAENSQPTGSRVAALEWIGSVATDHWLIPLLALARVAAPDIRRAAVRAAHSVSPQYVTPERWMHIAPLEQRRTMGQLRAAVEDASILRAIWLQCERESRSAILDGVIHQLDASWLPLIIRHSRDEVSEPVARWLDSITKSNPKLLSPPPPLPDLIMSNEERT